MFITLVAALGKRTRPPLAVAVVIVFVFNIELDGAWILGVLFTMLLRGVDWPGGKIGKLKESSDLKKIFPIAKKGTLFSGWFIKFNIKKKKIILIKLKMIHL